MQTKLMRIEEDFFPSAGDAKPLGPPIPRGVPVQTIYSKRLGEAGFKTGQDGKQSYTPGKAVVDAANGYVTANTMTGAQKAITMLEILERAEERLRTNDRRPTGSVKWPVSADQFVAFRHWAPITAPRRLMR